ncbi:MAG: hypothetical protein R2864_01610 [Syntrophotaleaceae bacterium]
MAGKIFYRERKKYVDGSKTPRYIVSAVADVNLKVYAKHMRMSELKQLAEELGAELIPLKRGPKH